MYAKEYLAGIQWYLREFRNCYQTMFVMSRGLLLAQLVDNHLIEQAVYLRDIAKKGLVQGYHGAQARSFPSYVYNSIYCLFSYINLHVKSSLGYDKGVNVGILGAFVDVVLIVVSGIGFVQMSWNNPNVQVYGMKVINTVWLGWCVILFRIFAAIMAMAAAVGPEQNYLLTFPKLFEMSAILTLVHFLYLGQLCQRPSQPAFYLSMIYSAGRVDTAPPAYTKRADDSAEGCVTKVSDQPCKCKLKEECGICLQCQGKESCVLTLPCQHSFHVKCIEIWGEHGNSCPMCRSKFTLRYQHIPQFAMWQVDAI